MNDMIDEIDFLISGVKYDEEGIIDKVSVHEKMDDYGVGYPYEESRQEMIQNMDEGNKYFTLVFSDEGKFDYTVGEEIKLVDVDGEKYLRVDGEEPRDSLGPVTKVSDIQPFEER